MIRPTISLLVSALSLAGLFNTALAETSVRVAFVKGDAKLLAANGIERTIKKGDIIRPGEKIITAPGCTLQAFVDKSGIIAIRPNSQVLFEKLDATKSSLQLLKGNVRVHTGIEHAKADKMLIELKTSNGLIPIKNADNETSFIPKKSTTDKEAKKDQGDSSGTYTRFIKGSGALITSSKKLDLQTNQIGKLGDAPAAVPIITARIDPTFVIGPTLPVSGSKSGDPTPMPVQTGVVQPIDVVSGTKTIDPIIPTPIIIANPIVSVKPIDPIIVISPVIISPIIKIAPPPPLATVTLKNTGGTTTTSTVKPPLGVLLVTTK
jgi:hypothetical protein